MLGWNRWDLDIKSDKIELVKTKIQETKKIKKEREAEELRIKKLQEKYPGKSLEDINRIIKGKEIFNLNKKEQLRIIKNLNIKDTNLKLEEDRVEAILKIYDTDTSLVNQVLREDAKYIPSEEEKKAQVYFDMKKKDQVNLLIELGLSPKQIRNLKYEEDRVKKIMELQKKVKK